MVYGLDLNIACSFIPSLQSETQNWTKYVNGVICTSTHVQAYVQAYVQLLVKFRLGNWFIISITWSLLWTCIGSSETRLVGKLGDCIRYPKVRLGRRSFGSMCVIVASHRSRAILLLRISVAILCAANFQHVLYSYWSEKQNAIRKRFGPGRANSRGSTAPRTSREVAVAHDNQPHEIHSNKYSLVHMLYKL